jgi:hypothetical protein
MVLLVGTYQKTFLVDWWYWYVNQKNYTLISKIYCQDGILIHQPSQVSEIPVMILMNNAEFYFSIHQKAKFFNPLWIPVNDQKSNYL